MPQSHSSGFSMAEFLGAMTMVGIISALTIPSLLLNTDNSAPLVQTKTIASQIQEATITYKTNNSSAPTAMSDIASLLKYSSSFTSGTLVTGGPACAAATPCYRFPDGSVLMASTWNAGTNLGQFRYDPDGVHTATAGNPDRSAVILMLDYNISRVTTWDAYYGIAFTDNVTPHLDPAYVRAWTKL